MEQSRIYKKLQINIMFLKNKIPSFSIKHFCSIKAKIVMMQKWEIILFSAMKTIIIRLGFSKIVTKAASGSRTWKIKKSPTNWKS